MSGTSYFRIYSRTLPGCQRPSICNRPNVIISCNWAIADAGGAISMKLVRVRQKLVSNSITDVSVAVHAALDRLNLTVPQGDVGITAGSRGIANIAVITKEAGEWLSSLLKKSISYVC